MSCTSRADFPQGKKGEEGSHASSDLTFFFPGTLAEALPALEDQ